MPTSSSSSKDSPKSPSTVDASSLTVKKLKETLKENKVSYDNYRKKKYYVELYEEHILNKVNGEAVEEKVTKITRKTPSKSASKASSSQSTTRRTPITSRKNLKRKHADTSKSAEEPPKKKLKEASTDSKQSNSKKPNLKISGNSNEVNQLRASKHDATPMPTRNNKTSTAKSFASPSKLPKPSSSAAVSKELEKSSFVDPNLLKSTSKKSSSEQPSSSKDEEPKLLEEVEEEDATFAKERSTTTTEDEEESNTEELKTTPLIYLLRLLLVVLFVSACYYGLTSFDSSSVTSPFQSNVNIQRRAFCNPDEEKPTCEMCPKHGVCSDGKLIRCKDNYIVKNYACVLAPDSVISNMAYDVQRELTRLAQKSSDACLSLDASMTEQDAKDYLYALHEPQYGEETFRALQHALAEGSFSKLRINTDNQVISLARGPTAICCARRIFLQVCEHKKSIFAALTLVVLVLILTGYDDESESVSILQSAMIHRLREARESEDEESQSVSLKQLQEELKEQASDVYSGPRFTQALDQLRKDPRVVFGDDGEKLVFSE